MNHTAFFKLISGNELSGAYLLHGEEEYVKDQALQAVLATADEAARDLNIQFFDSAEAQAIIEACEMLPFFSSRRIVVCRALPLEEQWKKIDAYIPSMPASTLLIFIVRSNANASLGIVKSMKAGGRLVQFDILDENEAIKWVCQQAHRYGSIITPASARFLVKLVGCSLCDLRNEFIKAADYAGPENEITNEIISKAVTRNIEYGVFSMIDYFIAGKTADGLRALDSLLERESAFSIAALMAGRFKLMLQAKICAEQGMDKNSAAAKIGGSPYAAKSAFDAAKRYSKQKLEKNILAFSDVGYQQISGQMKDVEALELAVLHCAP